MLLLARAQFLLNPPIFVGVQSVAQSLPNNTFTAITFDTSIIDTYGGHSNVTNNSRYTAQVAGWYQVSAQSGTMANTAGQRAPCLFINGVGPTTQIIETQLSASQSGNTLTPTGGLVFLNVGDYVEVRVDQNSGGALNTYAAGCFMSVLWVHA